jgi:cyanophycinase
MTSSISIKYPVMVIGGAEDKVNGCDILSAFFESAGGSNAIIGIIPCASQEPAIVGERYVKIFQAMGAKQIQVLDIRSADECNDARWLNVLDHCTGIFVTGGDQVRLCALLGNSKLVELMQARIWSDQMVLAGTSAGAAMMGSAMIAGGSSGESPNVSLVELSEGLGIIPEMLVDQHFHNRNRMARLFSAIAVHPNRLGIGIDEDTCAALGHDGTFLVMGKGTITIVDPVSLTHTNHPQPQSTDPVSLHNLKVHVLCPGDRYDYKNRAVLD